MDCSERTDRMEASQQCLMLRLGISTKHNYICWTEMEVLCSHRPGFTRLQTKQFSDNEQTADQYTEGQLARKATHYFIILLRLLTEYLTTWQPDKFESLPKRLPNYNRCFLTTHSDHVFKQMVLYSRWPQNLNMKPSEWSLRCLFTIH